MSVTPIVTVHRSMPSQLLDPVLTGIETALLNAGATGVWIDGTVAPEFMVMARMPETATSQ
ncbi:hypothetical protein [Nocardioides marmotae]|uniref:hypothetical protein n=1 Tax=Nocardioides marmotae TaxID=2663857 RepID=UPI0012B52BBA|nr:hypothetical protein [Nocardioides marmotae]MBC9735533.1 hypothetical protein [Nocardioides marmotae]MTB86630.1 hypothetical protein [Nocardioides marmotae]